MKVPQSLSLYKPIRARGTLAAVAQQAREKWAKRGTWNHEIDLENVEIQGNCWQVTNQLLTGHQRQRLFLEAWHSVRDKNSINEHVALPSVYKNINSFRSGVIRNILGTSNLFTLSKFLRDITSPFSSPEPTIILTCGRDRELWPAPIFWACAEYSFRILSQSDLPDMTGSPWIADFRFWTKPEVSIPAAGQNDRGLWGRECYLTGLR